MINDSFQSGESIALIVYYKGDRFDVLIDKDDYGRLVEFGYKWHYHNGWIRTSTTVSRKKKNIMLHRFIMNPPDDMVIDHINHNPLDNRKENLRIVTATHNRHNQNGAKSDSKTGIRGVSYYPQTNKYLARVRMNGKAVFQQYFESILEAEISVQQARQKFMPHSTN